MRVVQVLEKDPKSQKEIVEALISVDPKIHIRIFESIEEYAKWVPMFVKSGKAAVFAGGKPAEQCLPLENTEDPPEVNLIIFDAEQMGSEHIDLIKRTRQLYSRRKAGFNELPPSIIMTAFESPDFDIKTWILPEINNLIFKPFDRLILSQHLIHALDGRNPPSVFTITNQKAETKMELLKDVPLLKLSDVGFSTRSDRQIPVGTFSKYYSDIWQTNMVKSVIAKVVSCQKVEGPTEQFDVNLDFFGLDPSQITILRKRLFKKAIEKKFEGKTNKLAILNLDKSIEDTNPWLKELGCVTISSQAEFYFQLDPDQVLSDAIPKTISGEKKTVDIWVSNDGEFFKSFVDQNSVYFLNLNKEQLKENRFSGLLEAKQRPDYRKLLFSDPGAGQCFNFTIGGKDNLVKLTKTGVDSQAGLISVKFEIPTKDEAMSWYRAKSVIPTGLQLVLVPQNALGENFEAKWSFLGEKIRKLFGEAIRMVVVAQKLIPEGDELKLSKIFDDIFYFPLDKSYFLLKLSTWFPEFKGKDSPDGVRSDNLGITVKAANPVFVSEISESGVIIKYNRKIEIGTYREFVLWLPYELGVQELLAALNFSEESGDPDLPFFCHFVFFGIRDNNLKNIRVWIRDNYVLGKEVKS